MSFNIKLKCHIPALFQLTKKNSLSLQYKLNLNINYINFLILNIKTKVFLWLQITSCVLF